MYSIEVSGLEEAASYFEEAAGDLPAEVSMKLEAVCQMIADYARQIAPYRTGRYAASIYVMMEAPLRILVGAAAPHSPIVEWGSMPHFILPRTRKVLKFEVEGETVFAKWVHHPGTAPMLILHRAKKANLHKIVEAIHEGVRMALKKGA